MVPLNYFFQFFPFCRSIVIPIMTRSPEAWELWKDGLALELMDQAMRDSAIHN